MVRCGEARTRTFHLLSDTESPDSDPHVRDHGRRLPGREIDLSWTTGWFTTFYPVRLPLQAASPADFLAEVGRRVAAVPDYGLGFSLLKLVTDGRPTGPGLPRLQYR